MALVLYQNQIDKFNQIEKDYKSVKQTLNKGLFPMGKSEKLSFNRGIPLQKVTAQVGADCFSKTGKAKTGLAVGSLFDVLPTYRRIERVPNKVDQSEGISAFGLLSLAILNGPEDMRDVRSSVKQIASKINKGQYKKSYNNTNAQHPFSFLRGTLLDGLSNPQKNAFSPISKFLLRQDTTLASTSFGKFVTKQLGVKTDIIKTKMNYPVPIPAIRFKPGTNYFSEIATRAMLRTTKFGTMALAGIEFAHFSKRVNDGYGIISQAKKSCVNLVSTILAIGIVGAMGAKHFGATGSLAGMGVGAYFGNKFASRYERQGLLE